MPETLRHEIGRDMREAEVILLGWKDDERGEEYGKSWQPIGDPVPCHYIEVGVSERQESGRQETQQLLRLIFDLGPPHFLRRRSQSGCR